MYKRSLKNADFTKIFCVVMLMFGIVLFLVNIIFHGRITQDLFLKDPLDTGMDFYTMIAASFKPFKIKLLEATSFYPPMALLFFRLLYLCIPKKISSKWPTEGSWSEILRGNESDLRIFSEIVIFYILFLVICILLIFTYLILKKVGTIQWRILFAVECIFTYGMIFTIERGNIILLSLPLLMFFLFFIDSEKAYLRIVAIVALSLSAGIKIYPALFGILLLTEKRIKDSIVAIVIGGSSLFVPIFCFGNGIEGISKYVNTISTFSESAGLGSLHGYSLQTIVKSIFHLLKIENTFVLKNIQWIAYVLLVLGCLLCFSMKEKWKKLTLLTIVMMIVPGTSMPYVSIFLLIPFVEFLNSKEGRIHTTVDWVYFVLFLLLLVPFSVPSFVNFEPYLLTNANFMRQITVLIFTILIFSDSIFNFFIRKRHKNED